MNWMFNDGGRAACGFVGLTGDCVTRAIAIATGKSYRTVYDDLKKLADRSPRFGVDRNVSDQFLSQQGWIWRRGCDLPLKDLGLDHRVAIVSLESEKKSGHLAAIVDNTIHDTWNPADDEDFTVRGYWAPPPGETSVPRVDAHMGESSIETSETQAEYEKVIRRLRALNNTAQNEASTEHEQHNALRMMQTLMLRHNLSRDVLVEKIESTGLQFTRMACPLNGSRACNWEDGLAWYITREVFPDVQFYQDRKGHRTFFWFYGPLADVEHSHGIFRELLLTIAASARLKFKGHSRGSGASYAEGFVAGLPKSGELIPIADREGALALVHNRTLIVHRQSKQWLEFECGIRLTKGSGGGRYSHDPAAEQAGRIDGAKQQIQIPKRVQRLTHRD
jgi:hypothetical protein